MATRGTNPAVVEDVVAVEGRIMASPRFWVSVLRVPLRGEYEYRGEPWRVVGESGCEEAREWG